MTAPLDGSVDGPLHCGLLQHRLPKLLARLRMETSSEGECSPLATFYNIIWDVCVREMETAVGHARYHAPLHLAPLSGHNDRGEPEAPPLLLSLFLAMRSYVQPHPVQTKFNSNKGI